MCQNNYLSNQIEIWKGSYTADIGVLPPPLVRKIGSIRAKMVLFLTAEKVHEDEIFSQQNTSQF